MGGKRWRGGGGGVAAEKRGYDGLEKGQCVSIQVLRR